MNEELFNYEKNIFNETRNIIVNVDENLKLNDNNLIKAMTVNENLRSLGYILKPKDIVRLSCASDLDEIFNKVSSFNEEVKAKPMYPNFPNQVMEMDKATFRFHQSMHYFSTYGIEALFDGVEVSKGWLPSVEDTEKTKDDNTILKEKVIGVTTYNESINIVNEKIIPKTERFTIPECELVKYLAKNNAISNYDVTFKENISLLVEDDFGSKEILDVYNACRTLSYFVKNSGDVLDFIWKFISKNRRVLRTTQKKNLIKVLEKFPISDFSENLALKRERNLIILRSLSYNRNSNKQTYKEVVEKLRKNEIKTWNSKVEKKLFQSEKPNYQNICLDFIGNRQGILLRMCMRLIKLGFNPELIKNKLLEKSDKLNTQTLVSVLNWCGSEEEYRKRWFNKLDKKYMFVDKYGNELSEMDVCEINKNKEILYQILIDVLKENLSNKETCLFNKNVYIDSTMFNLSKSIIETNDKSQEGGYIRSGLAIDIPQEIERLRFFTYWNDRTRVDIDLHCVGFDNDDNYFHIGWNGDYKNRSVVHSGDITHSDAAEYIDIDINRAKEDNVSHLDLEIDDYTRRGFGNIDTVFTGMMVVDSICENVKLYDGKNVFFRHDLKSDIVSIKYATIDINDMILKINGGKIKKSAFNVMLYATILCTSQHCHFVENKDEADYVLSLDKTTEENNISLIDENYFMDC